MPESFMLDTSCESRPFVMTASGRVLTPPTATPPAAGDVDEDQALADEKPQAKVLTRPPARRPATGAKPTAK